MSGIAVIAILGLYIYIAIKIFKLTKSIIAKAIVLILALLIPTADAIYGRYKLKQMCATEGGLKVYRVASGVEGFMAHMSADEPRRADSFTVRRMKTTLPMTKPN